MVTEARVSYPRAMQGVLLTAVTLIFLVLGDIEAQAQERACLEQSFDYDAGQYTSSWRIFDRAGQRLRSATYDNSATLSEFCESRYAGLSRPLFEYCERVGAPPAVRILAYFYDSAGLLSHTFTTFFDDEDNSTLGVRPFDDIGLPSGLQFPLLGAAGPSNYRTSYHYGDTGQVLREQHLNWRGETIVEIERIYDASGVETRLYDGDADGEAEVSLILVRDSEQRLTSAEIRGGPLARLTRYEYDERGLLIREHTTTGEGPSRDTVTIYAYDASGRLGKTTRDVGNDGEIDASWAYYYDCSDELAEPEPP